MSVSQPPPPATGPLPLQGLRVVCFESRRSVEASRMIARQGGEPIEAPSLREVPLRGAAGIDALEAELLQGKPALLVLLTGVGTDLLVEGLCQSLTRERALELLKSPSTSIVCRGPKPHAVLKPLGIKPSVVVGEPNTWRDVLQAIDEGDLARGHSVFVQEYGRTNDELLAALAQRGVSDVHQIKTYAWALPEDLAPLHAAIERIARGEAEVALFTSGIQVTHLLEVAERLGATERLRAGFSRLVLASVGPLTSQALRDVDLMPDVEPEHPKLGHLVVALGAEGRAKLAEKRARA
ncbi:MAG TPA: uroporphyrinogen-III synthase [Polyangiaceae bacterium]|nr:uroporphyrinogen-III synthase [Polyangiaceae bacterium]